MSTGYTTKELADMKLPGFPGTAQGWDKLVKTRGWSFVETHGRGRGGVRREYFPPPEVQALIGQHRRGDPGPGGEGGASVARRGRKYYVGEGLPPAASPPQINATALGLILAGILEGMSDRGQKPDYQKAALKAVEYYQEAVREGLIAPHGGGIGEDGAAAG